MPLDLNKDSFSELYASFSKHILEKSSNENVDNTFDGKEDIDSETLQEQIDLKHAQTERYKSDTKDRRWLAEWSTALVSIWLFFVLIILVKNHECIHLSDSVLNVLLGTTTLNVLGLTFIVLRGHFNHRDSK